MHKTSPCPCGSNQTFEHCCYPIILNDHAKTPEALMRSRYSAYVLGFWDYLHQSWHPDTRPSSVSPTSTDWLGLSIINTSSTTVEFIATFNEGSKVMALHETSNFQYLNQHWRYVDGVCDISESTPSTNRKQPK